MGESQSELTIRLAEQLNEIDMSAQVVENHGSSCLDFCSLLQFGQKRLRLIPQIEMKQADIT